MVNDFQKILMETKQLLRDGGFLPFNYPGSGLAIQQLLGFSPAWQAAITPAQALEFARNPWYGSIFVLR